MSFLLTKSLGAAFFVSNQILCLIYLTRLLSHKKKFHQFYLQMIPFRLITKHINTSVYIPMIIYDMKIYYSWPLPSSDVLWFINVQWKNILIKKTPTFYGKLLSGNNESPTDPILLRHSSLLFIEMKEGKQYSFRCEADMVLL